MTLATVLMADGCVRCATQAARQSDIVSGVGIPRPSTAPAKRPRPPSAEPEAEMPRSPSPRPQSPLAETEEEEGRDRTAVRRVGRQVDMLLSSVRPALLAWTRSAV